MVEGEEECRVWAKETKGRVGGGKRKPKECMAKMAILHRNQKLGKGSPTAGLDEKCREEP